MKKIFIVFCISNVLLACGSTDKTRSTGNIIIKDSPVDEIPLADSAKGVEIETSLNPETEKGKELILKSDCQDCHKVNEKLVGPSYAEVAKKYEVSAKNIDNLASKIISGGLGSWGNIPMGPHPSINQDDAKEMVKYILSIK